jgi:hypothetical protein
LVSVGLIGSLCYRGALKCYGVSQNLTSFLTGDVIPNILPLGSTWIFSQKPVCEMRRKLCESKRERMVKHCNRYAPSGRLPFSNTLNKFSRDIRLSFLRRASIILASCSCDSSKLLIAGMLVVLPPSTHQDVIFVRRRNVRHFLVNLLKSNDRRSIIRHKPSDNKRSHRITEHGDHCHLRAQTRQEVVAEGVLARLG